MPTVRLRKASEYPETAQRLFELSKAWFNVRCRRSQRNGKRMMLMPLDL